MDIIFNAGDYSKLRNKTVLITGAYGMLASYMVYFLLYLNEIHEFNIEIISLSRSAEKFNSRFGVHAHKVKQINKSVNEYISLDCDYIIHAANFASSQYYTVCPVDVVLPNMLGTYNLLELAYTSNARFLYFSTCSVYGTFQDRHSPITEKDFGVIDPLAPRSCYDESKRAGETLCAAYFRQKGVQAIIARIAHTYGPTMDIENDSRVFASFVKNAIRGENIEIKSDGSAKRSFCYITDATIAYLLLLLKGEAGEAYNVCNSDQTVQIRELGELISNIAEVDFVYVKRDESEAYLEAPKISEVIISCKKLNILGFSFNISIQQGFTRVISHFKKEHLL
jgi:nucleoside-diphosphate-sugar epimerase